MLLRQYSNSVNSQLACWRTECNLLNISVDTGQQSSNLCYPTYIHMYVRTLTKIYAYMPCFTWMSTHVFWKDNNFDRSMHAKLIASIQVNGTRLCNFFAMLLTSACLDVNNQSIGYGLPGNIRTLPLPVLLMRGDTPEMVFLQIGEANMLATVPSVLACLMLRHQATPLQNAACSWKVS